MAKPATDKCEIITAIPAACGDEKLAVELLEDLRWGDEPACPHCGADDVYKMTKRGSQERNERFLWRCRGCGKQYTVRVGTVMEESRIPLRHWCYAYWAACASKKGVSALQIKRQTGLTYKSALFLMHRIRWAMRQDNPAPLKGDVEADETYVGGKPRRKNNPIWIGRQGPAEDFKDRKTPVVAIVERGGNVRAMATTEVKAQNLRQIIREMTDPKGSRLITDELASYRKIGPEFERGHETVNHGRREYARGDINTNTVESFFALLKRGVYGTFHNVSRKHLHRYVSEFEFRWNTRKFDDGARIKALIQNAEGKRLMYRHP
jgi:transposase-like protein